MKKVKQDGLTYLINEKEEKAEVVGFYEYQRNNFLIPRSIKYESQEYIVVSISKKAFQNSGRIKSVEFASDSELQTIEKKAFSNSSIESIYIPASVIDLKEGWCSDILGSITVRVDPKNTQYLNYEDEMIICKTTETSEKHDKIVFVRRDLEEITIPSFIKTIGSFAFNYCGKLLRVNIPSNSELQTIEEEAFAYSSIESIFIPPHVTKICKNAFKFCRQLQQIDIPSNSELQTIEKNAFDESSIESIFIPASLIDLKEGWCSFTYGLTTVEVDPRNSRYLNYEDEMIICKTTETSENYDKIVFVGRDIEEITIPSFIKTIGSFAFNCCEQFQLIEIPPNSELQTIEKEAFSCSLIESIFIPPHVTKICKYAFSFCKQLQLIDIPSNSELQTIEKDAFSDTSIESIFIPASLIDLKEGWCINTEKLTKIKIDPRNKRYSYLDEKMIICKTSETSENYDKIVFVRRDIEEITIPSFIKIIGSYAFNYCKKLRRIDIPSNSELQTIEKGAFTSSSIKNIFIPPHVTKICDHAFSFCRQLRRIDISSNSELKTIEKSAFRWSSIEKIFIPPQVTTICKDSFSFCGELQRIDIPSNSELQTIEKGAFSFSSIKSIFIPPHATIISENTFLNCRRLNLIEIDEKSEIELYDISSIFQRGAIVMIPVKYFINH